MGATEEYQGRDESWWRGLGSRRELRSPSDHRELRYRICEIASAANCDKATVTVTVQPLFIYAANDSGRGSSKLPNTVVASVLTNDRLGNGLATIGSVSLAFVSLTPANNKIRLDLTFGHIQQSL